jgi:hypothetical protein
MPNPRHAVRTYRSAASSSSIAGSRGQRIPEHQRPRWQVLGAGLVVLQHRSVFFAGVVDREDPANCIPSRML